LTGTGVVENRHMNVKVMTTGIGWWNMAEIMREWPKYVSGNQGMYSLQMSEKTSKSKTVKRQFF